MNNNIRLFAATCAVFATASFTATLSAQELDAQTQRWLLHNPTSAERADVLLRAENDQIAEYGKYDVTPFQAPLLYQLRPSQEYLQYFYDGQNQLAKAAESGRKPDYKSLRARYQRLYNMGDPASRNEASYYLGYIDYAEGKYTSALKHFDALPLEPKYQETVPFYRMQILYAQGKWNDAIRQAEAYTPAEEVFQIEALRIKAECLLQSGRQGEALSAFRQYLSRTHTPVASSAYNAGVLEFQQRQYATAIADGGLATQSQYSQLRQQAYMLVGQAALQQANTQQARMAFEQAADIADGDQDTRILAAYNVCAIAHNSNSVWGDEVKVLETFLNNYPTSAYADRVSQYLVQVYSTTRNYSAALQSIAKIKSPGKTLMQAKQHLHYQWGVQHYLNAGYQQAEAQFDQSTRLGSLDAVSYAESYFWRGEARYHQSNYRGAVSDYQMFVRLNERQAQPGLFAAALYNCGYAQMKLEDYNSAIGSLSRYITQPGEPGTETYTDGMLRLADCYYYTRQFAQAQGYYHTASEAESKQRDYALYQEALMMGLQKNYAGKQAKLDELLADSLPSDLLDDAWLDKGRTSLLQNDAPAAIHSFQQVLDHYGESPIAPQAAVELAMTYNSLGQTDAAQRVYEMVAQRWPDTDAAQTAAEDLKTLEVQKRISSLPGLYEAAQYTQLLETYQSLQQENIDFREAQIMQVLAGKAHLKLEHYTEATELLTQASSELRTAAGSEAKYLLAQLAYDQGRYDEASNLDSELIQSGTPHQYWLARGIILMSDMQRNQGETFTADEYLKSLQQNYTTQDDIQTMIEQRLQASAAAAAAAAADTTIVVPVSTDELENQK
ncbi:MAG: tetratricopeptide repeat protein [Bacteroidales bacterium]|nr:tetratricopeptide repeat protein [Bacteroidales bacterium]